MELLMPIEGNTRGDSIGEDFWLPQVDLHEPFDPHAAPQLMQVDFSTSELPSNGNLVDVPSLVLHI